MPFFQGALPPHGPAPDAPGLPLLSERLALTSLVLSSTIAGWSAYRFQRSIFMRRFQAADLHSYHATLDNGQVHYWAGGKGDGKPLLLIHGFGADAMFGWGEQAPLAKDRFVIMPDLLWFGESHSHASDFSPRFQAETIVQLLDHLAIEHVDVVGISYGGFVAGELASGWGERVDRLVIVDSPGHTYTMDDYHDMLDRLGLDSVGDLVVPEDPSGVARLLQVAYHRPPPIVPNFVAKDVYAHMFVRWKREKIRLLDFLLSIADDVGPDDYDIDCPAMVLWGEHDNLFPAPLGFRLASAVNAPTEVRVMPGAAHAPNMERPALFNRHLTRFFETTPSRA